MDDCERVAGRVWIPFVDEFPYMIRARRRRLMSEGDCWMVMTVLNFSRRKRETWGQQGRERERDKSVRRRAEPFIHHMHTPSRPTVHHPPPIPSTHSHPPTTHLLLPDDGVPLGRLGQHAAPHQQLQREARLVRLHALLMVRQHVLHLSEQSVCGMDKWIGEWMD